MNKLERLRREYREAVRRLEDIHDAGLTSETTAEFDDLVARTRTLKDEIAREEALQNCPNPAGFGGFARGHELAVPATRDSVVGPAESRTWAGMFAGDGRELDRHGFDDWEQFVWHFENDPSDRRMRDLRSMGTSPGSDGGFLVPEAFAAQMLDPGLEAEVIRPRCQVWPITNAGSLKVPGWNGSDHSSSLYGGFTAAWTAERGTISESDADMRQVELKPHKLVIATSVTRELEQDSFSGYAGYLRGALAKAISFNIDLAMFEGSGAGRPLGILNGDCVVSVAKEDSQLADTLTLTNLAKMYSRMLPASVANAVWIVHPSTIPELLTLSLTVGTGGSAYPIMRDSGGLLIYNRPVIISEKCKPLGDTGDVWFADLSWYGAAVAQEVRIDRSEHVHWTTDRAAYRAIVRIDGQPLLDSAVTPVNGTDTLSPFVKLDERA